MKSKSVRTVGKSVEENQKAILIVAGIGLAFYFIKKFTDKMFSKSESSKSQADKVEAETEEQTKKDVKELEKSGIKPSYSDSQYKIFAGTLKSAMQGFGTEEQKIYAVFRYLKNDADFLKLNAAFGMQSYDLRYLNLAAWLSAELNSVEIASLNNNILKPRGITYRY